MQRNSPTKQKCTESEMQYIKLLCYFADICLESVQTPLTAGNVVLKPNISSTRHLGYIWQQMNILAPQLCLKSKKIFKFKDLSEFGRRRFLIPPQVAAVCGGLHQSKVIQEGTLVKRHQGCGGARLFDACGKGEAVQSIRGATVV